MEERAKRHLEAAGEGGSDVESASESDPVIDALQCSEDAVSCMYTYHYDIVIMCTRYRGCEIDKIWQLAAYYREIARLGGYQI